MKRILLLCILSLSNIGWGQTPCAQIYYDRGVPKPDGYDSYPFGRVHALFLQNLLGHFPKWQQVVLPVEKYQRGDLERCSVSFYLGTHYASPIPKAFYEDYARTKKTVVWMGYNIWQLGAPELERLWRVRFRGLSRLDEQNLDARGRPSFYRYVDYQGETFEKYGAWDRLSVKKYLGAFEVALFEETSPDGQSFDLASIRHSATGATSPYVLRHANHWYLAESPFAFMGEDDRYLVFADLLFDILNEKPLHAGKKPALIRLEDLHPLIPSWQIERLTEVLRKHHVPFSVSLIPHYVDPLGVSSASPDERDIPISAAPEFVRTLDGALQKGGSLILHGFTHQYGTKPNPFNATSGDDFEFWDRVANRPIAEESVPWALGRLDDAVMLVERAAQRFHAPNLKPVAWLTPHYQCSPLLCSLFGEAWTWTIGRNIYFPHRRTETPRLAAENTFDRSGTAGSRARLDHFKNLSVPYDRESAPSGQFFPYEIFGDIYGQRVLPENLGNLQPYLSEQVHKTQNVDDMIRAMKRNRVLRDVWASFFVHPFLLLKKEDEGLGTFSGDVREIERLVVAVLDSGYEFIDLKTWVRRSDLKLRPQPIERDR